MTNIPPNQTVNPTGSDAATGQEITHIPDVSEISYVPDQAGTAAPNQPVNPVKHSIPYKEIHYEFAQFEHSYINGYIAFADQKAGAIFTISSALLVYMFNESMLVIGPCTWKLLGSWAAALGLGLSSLFSLLVVLPNLTGSGKGIVFWQSVSSRRTSAEYAKEVGEKSFDALTGEVLQHCKELADICTRKYKNLRHSMMTLYAGILFLLVALYLT